MKRVILHHDAVDFGSSSSSAIAAVPEVAAQGHSAVFIFRHASMVITLIDNVGHKLILRCRLVGIVHPVSDHIPRRKKPPPVLRASLVDQLLQHVWVCEECTVVLRIAKQGRTVAGPAADEVRSRRGVLGRAVR